MDVFMPIALCVIFIILFTICGWCCKRKREGTIYGYGPSVTVTTTTQHIPSPQVLPPYPIDARHPTPGNVAAPPPGFATRQPPYPTQTPNMPFPQAVSHIYGLPSPTIGAPVFQHGQHLSYYGYPTVWSNLFNSTAVTNPVFMCRSSRGFTFPLGIPNPPLVQAPYPPTHYQDYNSNPPPYEVAISQAPTSAPFTNEGYGKQAPYNPNYN